MCRMQTFTKIYFTFSVKPSLAQRVVRAHDLRVEDKTTFYLLIYTIKNMEFFHTLLHAIKVARGSEMYFSVKQVPSLAFPCFLQTCQIVKPWSPPKPLSPGAKNKIL